jgi:predicted aconitase with swiveling domain
MGRLIHGKPLVAGQTRGLALVSREPLSFWGGYDQTTGEIIDRRHPLSGRIAAGRILALPSARGSSTTTSVLLEAVRAGNAPAALVTDGVDRFFTLASIVADEMYGKPIPLIALTTADFMLLENDRWVEIALDGTLTLSAGDHETKEINESNA